MVPPRETGGDCGVLLLRRKDYPAGPRVWSSPETALLHEPVWQENGRASLLVIEARRRGPNVRDDYFLKEAIAELAFRSLLERSIAILRITTMPRWGSRCTSSFKAARCTT